jgi:hypothetical protein
MTSEILLISRGKSLMYIVTDLHYAGHPLTPASGDTTEEQLCQATIAAVM